MQDSDLFTKHPSDNDQRLDQHGHIGKALDELLDASSLTVPTIAHLETEVAQGAAQVVLDHTDTKFGASWSFQLSAYAGLAKSDADEAAARISAQSWSYQALSSWSMHPSPNLSQHT
jgi:hypothetical protein